MLGTLGSSRRSWSDRSREIDRMKGQQPEIESRSYSMESSHPRDNPLHRPETGVGDDKRFRSPSASNAHLTDSHVATLERRQRTRIVTHFSEILRVPMLAYESGPRRCCLSTARDATIP